MTSAAGADGCRAAVDPTTRPARRPGAQEFELGEELLVYVPGDEMAHALNRSAAAIWGLCDGVRTVEDISSALGETFDRPAPMLLPDIRLGVERLCELGLLDRDPERQ